MSCDFGLLENEGQVVVWSRRWEATRESEGQALGAPVV